MSCVLKDEIAGKKVGEENPRPKEQHVQRLSIKKQNATLEKCRWGKKCSMGK